MHAEAYDCAGEISVVTLDTRPDHHNFGFAGGLYDADTGLTRFGSLSHLLTVLGELETLGVAFVSLDDGIDTQTASGRLFLQIRGALAEYEAALVRERTLAGLDAARRRGKKLGRPPALSITQTARARRMAASGQSVRYIAGVLGA